MAHHNDPVVVKHRMQNLLTGLAKDLNRRIYGEEGVPWGTKFADIEELAVQIGRELSRGMIEQAMSRQAEAVPSEAETCSGCGGSLQPTEAVAPRDVGTQVGTAQWNEPKRYCSKCRAAFFPAVPRVGD